MTNLYLADYTLETIQLEDDHWILYSATKGAERYCIKVYKGDDPHRGALLLQHEHFILSLIKEEGILHSLEFHGQGKPPFLVKEELSGISLEDFTAGRLFPLETVLSIATSLCKLVAGLHTCSIQHSCLTPQSVFIDPDSEHLKLITCTSSTRLKQREALPIARNTPLTTLAYLAPENTGYTTQYIDYRSDIYSCGMILYEMLLGHCSFSATTSMDLVRLILNEQVPPPRDIDPSIPQAVSDIVMKCLQKEAEKRYASAEQLADDLQDCLEQLRSHGVIFDTSFTDKIPHHPLQMPSHLIGRENEMLQLQQIYNRTMYGQCHWILLTGANGSGKSALARSLLRYTAQNNGYFIIGKFGAENYQIPYISLNQALNNLVEQILQEEPSHRNTLKNKISDALEGHGGVLTELFPALEKLIGVQPKELFLHSQESQTRQVILFKRFISAIASEHSPLVLFLDDLQWGDFASLRLMKALAVDPLIRHVLLIGAYREEAIGLDKNSDQNIQWRVAENSAPIATALSDQKFFSETDQDQALQPNNALVMILQEMEQEQASVSTMRVNNLSLHDTLLLVETILSKSTQEKELNLSSFADALYKKTEGNPLFLISLLQRLENENLLSTLLSKELTTTPWISWPIFTKSLEDLLIERIHSMPAATQRLLSLGAEIGSNIDLNLLALTAEIPATELLLSLWFAVDEGIIIPSDENYYQLEGVHSESPYYEQINFHFTQNDLYNAVIHFLTLDEKIRMHYIIGKQQLRQATETTLHTHIFQIISHLNRARPLLNSAAERLQLAKLNLEACRKAQAAVAHNIAYECIKIAKDLLPTACWQQEYALTYAIYLESTTCAYLMKRFQDSEQLSAAILNHAKTPLDRGRLYLIKINFYTNTSQNKLAIQEGITCLNLFGIRLSSHPGKITLLYWLGRVRWLMRGKKIPDLAFLPPMRQEDKLFVMEALMALSPAAFIVDKELICLIILHMMDCTLQYGSCEQSFFAFLIYAAVLEILFRDYPTAYQFGLLALQLAEQSQDSAAIARANYSMAVIINHWTQPLPTNRVYMDRCYNFGVTAGELVLLAFICMFYGALDGEFFYDLERSFNSLTAHKGLVLACKNKLAIESFTVREKILLALTSEKFEGIDLKIVGFDEQAFFNRTQDDPELFSAIQAYVSYKMLVLCLFGNFSQAVDLFNATTASRRAAITLITERILNFYHSLALLMEYKNATFLEKGKIIFTVAKNQRQLKWWVSCCPANNLHRYLLIEAERARLKGKTRKAITLYEKACQQACQENHIMEEALIRERAAAYHASLGHQVVAKGYLSKAYSLFYCWGSKAKLHQMVIQYPELRSHPKVSAMQLSAGISTNEKREKISSFEGDLIDLITVEEALDISWKKKGAEKLSVRLIELAAANAGADRALFFLEHQGSWRIFLEYNNNKATLWKDLPLARNKSPMILPIIHYAMRTGENVIIKEPSPHIMAINYPESREVRSLMAIPVVKQNNKTIALLYLENHAIPNAFCDKLIPILSLLGSQLTTATENEWLHDELTDISNNLEIINARLKYYSENLEKKIARRTGELENKNRELQKSTSHLKVIQKQVLQQEKLAGIGSLAQGFAHEIKNPLNFINNFASLSNEMLADMEQEQTLDEQAHLALQQIKEIMIEIGKEGQRADNIIINMLHFADG